MWSGFFSCPWEPFWGYQVKPEVTKTVARQEFISEAASVLSSWLVPLFLNKKLMNIVNQLRSIILANLCDTKPSNITIFPDHFLKHFLNFCGIQFTGFENQYNRLRSKKTDLLLVVFPIHTRGPCKQFPYAAYPEVEELLPVFPAILYH